jgi:hypothetical protein
MGNEILYEVTIEDPGVLVEPWVMAPRTPRLSTAPAAGFLPGGPIARFMRRGAYRLRFGIECRLSDHETHGRSSARQPRASEVFLRTTEHTDNRTHRQSNTPLGFPGLT